MTKTFIQYKHTSPLQVFEEQKKQGPE